jgi:hypothetical protein
MLQRLLILVEQVVGAARRAFCGLIRAHTRSLVADVCLKRHACKHNTYVVLDGGEAGHAKLPVPAYVPAFARLPTNGLWPVCG